MSNINKLKIATGSNIVVDYTMTIPPEITNTGDFLDNLENSLNIILRSGPYEIAERFLDYSTNEKPNEFIHWFNLGAVCISLGKYTKAKNATLKAIEINQDSSHAWHNLARVYEKLGMEKESKEASEKSRQLAETYGDNQLKFDRERGWYVN